ncbi:hypothetical protein RKD05_001171 [Microbacterium sp. SLBN-111]
MGLRRAVPRRQDRARTRAAGEPRRADPRSGRRHRRLLHPPTGFGTQLAEGKETRRIDGRDYVLEYPIHADVALISARRADRWGNLVYRETARNFGPIMAAAAKTTVVQVDEIVPLGNLDPEAVVTPGLYVDRVVAVGERRWLNGGVFVGGVDIEGRPLAQNGADA